MLPATRDRSTLSTMRAPHFNRLLDRFFNDGDFFVPWNGSDGLASIPLAMWEDENFVFVEADAPGMRGEDIDVSVHNGQLVIRGERKSESSGNGYDTRSFGRFEQRVTLPSMVKSDQIDAKLTNGVLKLSMPKSEEAKPQKVTVKSD